MKREKGLFLYVFSGSNVKEFFQNEIGSHRWQRIPPTESKGRVHTSTITVAVMDDDNYEVIKLEPYEYRIETTRGTGKGGQHRNTTDSCVILTHYSTGIKVVRDGRDQHKNKEEAIKELTKRVNDFYKIDYENVSVEERRDQIGKGLRSEKRRTYRVKDSLVIDHITDKKTNLKNILKGKLELLH